ncbi:hypothetical protein FA09DRAFT_56175 [Tilletiopsis washingtonensis]|uniref:Uncharacterized protein n=1 Tax=Tilletiopsis washingtonensis TaxID=58919 RepID=A0A316Z7C2_9BASI|nr:hypothetical protein FA09DRAFT_56175 [Tilletiopsis washingtonensis]PWN97471.1 hypothetical protein FA09DRAFT_56175 [Tilletiopsis washingtonensis]
MLMEFGLPGGDHSCAALMNLELIRIIEVTCERLRVSHASLSGAKDVSAISMNTRQAAELRSQDEERVKAAERSWRDVKDAAYQELYPCGELRGGLGDEDENRIEYMRRWLGRRRAVSMNHTDPLATASTSVTASNAFIPPRSLTSSAGPTTTVQAAVSLSPLETADEGHANDADSPVLERSETTGGPLRYPGPWDYAATGMPSALKFLPNRSQHGACPSAEITFRRYMNEKGNRKARWRRLLAAFDDAVTARAEALYYGPKAANEDLDAHLEADYLDFVGSMLPVRTTLLAEIAGREEEYRNSRVPFSDAVVEEIEWELWNWYCWLLAVGLPPDSIEFGALYMRGRWHASEYAAAGEVPAFHDM